MKKRIVNKDSNAIGCHEKFFNSMILYSCIFMVIQLLKLLTVNPDLLTTILDYRLRVILHILLAFPFLHPSILYWKEWKNDNQ